MSQSIQSPKTAYQLDAQLAKTAAYTVYLVTDEADGRTYMLKASPDILGNGRLDREALILKDIEAEVVRIRGLEPEGTKHGGFRFEKCFPRLVESFTHKTNQGNQRINIIDIPAADLDADNDLFPLEHIRSSKRSIRSWIDPKTSAWIMGRVLKIFTLIHPIGVAVQKADGGNILIRPGEWEVRSHRALFFDWSEAHQYDTCVPPETVGEEIAAATKSVFLALGGNLATGALPESDQLTEDRYANLLVEFMSGRQRDPDKARARFYALVNEIWESEFHPFTVIPI